MCKKYVIQRLRTATSHSHILQTLYNNLKVMTPSLSLTLIMKVGETRVILHNIIIQMKATTIAIVIATATVIATVIARVIALIMNMNLNLPQRI